jgi:hypothetical protein
MVIAIVCLMAMTTFATTATTEDWVYPDEAINEFTKELGYRPNYRVEKWSENHWSLDVYFSHIDVKWGVEHFDDSFDGWRMKRADFEELISSMNSYFVKGVEMNGTYSKYGIEQLFEDHYGYDVDCKINVHHGEQFSATLIIHDYYNGCEYELDTILTTNGWRVTKQEWETFTTNNQLTDEVAYATEKVNWISISDLKEEFEARLGYCPEFDICRFSDGTISIEIAFEHLGGKSYFIDYVCEEGGEFLVTDKVFEMFLDENPETSYVLSLKMVELYRMIKFYKSLI